MDKSGTSVRKYSKAKEPYWNFQPLDNTPPAGSFLLPGQAWGVPDEDCRNVNLQDVDIVFPNQYGDF